MRSWRKTENLRLDRAHDLFADGAAADDVFEPPMGHTQRPSPGADSDPPFSDEDYLILLYDPLGQRAGVGRSFRIEGRRRGVPSNMSAGTPDEIEEERRLLYVAMTHAKRQMHLIHRIRFYRSQQPKLDDVHMFGPLSRFIPGCVLGQFERR